MVRLDLPARLSRLLPAWLTEALVAIAITGLFVGVRLMAVPLIGPQAPFALAFLSTVLATLIAGWRSGAMSLLLGTALIWYFVLPVRQSFAIADGATGTSIVTVLFAQTIILVALALYQREVRRGELDRQRRINFLGHAIREMDHRTKNNFQIVTSLLTLQGSRSASPEVQAALKEATERLNAVAAVYDALAPSSQGLATVRLQDQMEEICSQMRRGILPDGIALEAEIEPILLPHEIAVSIGIIVNELVTNACKHAFGDGGGTIRVRAAKEAGGVRIEVADNGTGFTPNAKSRKGLGTKLVAAFVKRVDGRAEVRSTPGHGTTHIIHLPLPGQ
jgi:two-component system, sensor histidine kinase PdtaS